MDPLENFIPMVLFCVIGYIFKSYYDYKLKKAILEKGELNANLHYLFARHHHPHSHSPLKWGIVIFAVGAALLIGEWFRYDLSEGMTVGLMLIFGGMALIFTHRLNGVKDNNTEPPLSLPENQA